MNVACVDCGDTIPGAARQRRRCDTCRPLWIASRTKPIRQLRPNEEPPPGEPRRYTGSHGYVRLRWTTETEHIETYEHRFVMQAQPGFEVHHIDGDRANNDPSNLRVLTPEEHFEAHGKRREAPPIGAPRRRIDVEEAVRLYDTGLGTELIGKILGHDPSAIWRALKRIGHPIRPGLGGGPKPKVPPT